MRKFLLSQHFLRSPRLALFLIGHSNIKKRDLVLEIGAGSGVITSALAKRAKKVLAFEPDAETAKKLRENLAKREIKNVEIFEQDFLEFDLDSLDETYKVFFNPPFSISSKIIHKFLLKNGYKYKPYINLKDEYVKKMIGLIIPVFIGVGWLYVSFAVIDFDFITDFIGVFF